MKTLKKKSLALLTLCLALALILAGVSLATESPNDTVLPVLEGIESPFQQVYKQVSQSVVGVNIVQKPVFYGGRVYSGAQSVLAGSGVVIGVDGNTRYIVTNNHVVEGATSFSIVVGEEEYQAELVARDEASDLAVLKVTDPAMNIPAVPMGDSDAIEVGEWALVIGTPISESFANTLTVGVVSGLNREITTRNRSSNRSYSTTMIQVDAAVNSGNSGGALFNTKGELIGIPSAKMSSIGVEGIGMAIPVNTVKTVVADLIEYQQVMRPRIGVSVATVSSGSDVPTEDTLPAGILVDSVETGSPAERAGIQAYDIIVEADGNRIRSTTELTAAIQAHQVGETLEITVYRIPNLGILKNGDSIPEGEYITMTVDVEIIDNKG